MLDVKTERNRNKQAKPWRFMRDGDDLYIQRETSPRTWETVQTVGSSSGGSSEYMYPVWAEEAAALANTSYEWAFGNGANTANDEGIVVYVPSGWTCTVVAMSLSLGAVPTAITVELVINGSLQGSNCNVTCTGVQHAVNDNFTPVSISNGDYINFRTTSVSGSTAGNNQVTAWLRMVKA